MPNERVPPLAFGISARLTGGRQRRLECREHPIVAPAAAHELCARQRSNIGSRVTREGHARFLGAPEGESPSGGSTTSDEISGWPSLHRHSRSTLINRHSSGSVP